MRESRLQPVVRGPDIPDPHHPTVADPKQRHGRRADDRATSPEPTRGLIRGPRGPIVRLGADTSSSGCTPPVRLRKAALLMPGFRPAHAPRYGGSPATVRPGPVQIQVSTPTASEALTGFHGGASATPIWRQA